MSLAVWLGQDRKCRRTEMHAHARSQGGGGDTHLDVLYRYVPRNRVWFLEVLDP